MPRIENLGPNVNEWCERTGNGSSTHDVCADCAQDFACGPIRDHNDKLQPGNGDPQGTEGWGNPECAHPCYSECDYHCVICERKLTEKDN